jgi:hypothetical protein
VALLGSAVVLSTADFDPAARYPFDLVLGGVVVELLI